MKEQINYVKGKNGVVVARCAGSLLVKPSGTDELLVRGEDVSWTETEDGFEITAKSSLDLRLPAWASLTINEAHGEVTVKGVDQDLKINTVHGDAILKNVVGATIQNVYGSLIVKHLQEDLQVGQVNGEFSFKHVGAVHIQETRGNISGSYANGDVTIESCLGDIQLRQVNGGVTLHKGLNDVVLRDIKGIIMAHAGGDLHLRSELDEGKHSLTAAHDVILRWPPDEPLVVSGQAGSLVNRLEWDEFSEKEGRFEGRIGHKGPHLEIEAAGRVVFKTDRSDSSEGYDFDFEFDLGRDFGRDFGQDFEAFGQRMAGLGEQIAAQVSHKMVELSSQLEGQFKAMRKREEAVRRAKDRMSGFAYAPSPPAPEAPPAPPPPAVNKEAVDNARFKVLEMLEQGKISVEEANVLLKALE